jgi:teichoic acid transport system permease protein
MIIRAVKEVLSEIWTNRARMMRIVKFDIKIENRNFYLGRLWKIITPMIYLGTFWFVFGIGIRGGAPIDGFPFLIWLLAGLVPWFFINRSITAGAMSIFNKSAMIFKIKYPVATVPAGAVIICLYDSFVMLVLMLVIFLAHGIIPNIYWLNIIYYTAFSFVFLVALAMVFSVVVQLAQDFGRLIASLLQLLFFLTPILWQEGNIPAWARPVFAVNPVRYIVTGYRNALLYERNFFERPLLIASFWGVTAVIFIFGCYLQRKYAKRFVDWM